MEARVDVMERKLRELFEVKCGYKDPATQARALEKHFRVFDGDGDGTLDFDEFSRAMVQLNFVGVQAEIEALFDRFDEDLNGVVSYSEFARAVVGKAPSEPQRSSQDTTRPLLERVRAAILEAGGMNGLRTLGVILRRMDQNGNGVIELDEFEMGLEDLGVDLGGQHDAVVRAFNHFDRDRSGKITVDELMRGLRGAMPKRRIKLVKEAFARLDRSGDGTVTIDEVEKLYDPSQHPEVLAGRMRPRDALLEFMRVFEESTTRDGEITWHEFLSYYKDLSAGIDHDDAFELMIRNAWHITGGTGWCANSSNRRVLVTFRDGTQRVVEIQNDLGIRANDKRAMIRQLTQEQGLRNVVDISLSN